MWRTWPIDLIVILSTASAYAAAPRIHAGHDPGGLSAFFASVAQASVTLLVAVALFSGALGGAIEHRTLRWVSGRTFLYLGAATVASSLGLVGSLDTGAYRYLFAASAGAGIGSLTTVLLMGWENIRHRRARGAAARAAALDPTPTAVSSERGSPRGGGASPPS